MVGWVRGGKLYHRAKSPQYNRENGPFGGGKKGCFSGYPPKWPFWPRALGPIFRVFFGHKHGLDFV